MDESSSSVKEQRIRNIALSYYSRKDVLDYLYKFSSNREVSPRYFTGFGKRPDSFQYPSDIFALVKKGATSFHCSEELWSNPLDLSTSLTSEDLNSLRKGWDVVIDIDCKWIYYSKKAAQAIIEVLRNHGVKNILVKFSGSKGFHIVIPWEAFPKSISDIETKDMFPEWPRAIVNYIKEESRSILEKSISDTASDFRKVQGFIGIKCENCNNLASENFHITARCDRCHPPHIESFRSSVKDYKKRKCPSCKSELKEQSSKKFFQCNRCELNSIENPSNFHEEVESIDIFEVLGLDVLLVSSRHLFRMPYSLHEKTALSSIIIDKKKIHKFELTDANPLNVKIKDFSLSVNKNEAGKLLIESIDWQKTQDRKNKERKIDYKKNDVMQYQNKKFEQIKMSDVKEDYLPPSIQKILKGLVDGRKRALFILLNLFRSLGLDMEKIDKKINDWNKLNKPPLKQGYINAQLQWHSKHKSIMPPNFDNEIYKAIGVNDMDHLSNKVKNPVNYVIRKSGAWRKKKK